MVPSLSLLSCESPVSVKKNPDKKKNFRTYTTVCSSIHFNKNCTIKKPANLSLMVINWLDFIWQELNLKGIPEQTIPWGHLLFELSLARLQNYWQNYLTITGKIILVVDTIIQQSLALFFNSHWHNCSTVAGKIVQQSLAIFFNSHSQYFFFYAGKISFNSEVHVSSIVPCTWNTKHDPKSISKL